MQSVLSLLTGAVMVVLVYGLSFIPSATLTRSDDIGVADDMSDDEGDVASADVAEALPQSRRRIETEGNRLS
jgi:hypothetical protein